jgi:hypothetical protein
LLLLIEAIMQGLGNLSELICYPLSHLEDILVYAASNPEISRNPCSHPIQFSKNETDYGLQTLVGLREQDETAAFDSILQRKLAGSLFSPFFICWAPWTPLPQMLDVTTAAFV